MNGRAPRHVFRLYVAGTAPSSVAAIRNVRHICAVDLAGPCELDVIDVSLRPDRLAVDGVVATPTLVRVSPFPIRHVVGDLSDRAGLLAALDIEPRATPEPPAGAVEGETSPDGPWRVLVETMRQGAVLLDRDGRVIYSNPWCAERLALPVAALPGVRFRERVAPGDREAFDALLEAGADATVDAEILVQGGVGSLIPMRVTICPAPKAETARVCLLLSDLTEARRTLAAQRLLLDVAMDAARIEAFGEALQCLLRRICEFTGWTAGETWIRAGARMRRRSAWTKDPGAEALARAGEDLWLRRGEGLAGEAWDAGRTVWTDPLSRAPGFSRRAEAAGAGVGAAVAVPVAARGQVVATLLFFTAARREADDAVLPTVVAAVSQVATILERRLAEEAVADALREKGLLVHELDDISSALAHDLRTPLRTIASFSQLVMDESGAELQPDARRRLQSVVDAAQRMSVLIHDAALLLDVPRTVPAPRRVDIGRIARETVSRLRAREPERAVVVDVERALHAVTDPKLARLVLEQLLENAWRFSACRAPAHIRVGATSGTEGRAFFVRDDGIGFDMSLAGKVFAPFVRLDGTAPGTGIGLALVQRAVTRLGGRAWCESAPGQGATFYVTLGPAA